MSLKDIWVKITLGLGAVVGFLLYYLSLKNRKINALKAEVELADTEKQADVLETKINGIKEDRKLIKKEVDEINKVLVDLDKKREKIKESHANKTDKEIEDYWENN